MVGWYLAMFIMWLLLFFMYLCNRFKSEYPSTVLPASSDLTSHILLAKRSSCGKSHSPIFQLTGHSNRFSLKFLWNELYEVCYNNLIQLVLKCVWCIQQVGNSPQFYSVQSTNFILFTLFYKLQSTGSGLPTYYCRFLILVLFIRTVLRTD